MRLVAFSCEHACVYAFLPVGDDPQHFPDLLAILILIYPFRVWPPTLWIPIRLHRSLWQEVPLLAVVVSYCRSSLIHIEFELDPRGTRRRLKTERIPAEIRFGIPAKKEHGPR